jgi:hypothetical protein
MTIAAAIPTARLKMMVPTTPQKTARTTAARVIGQRLAVTGREWRGTPSAYSGQADASM